METNRCFLHLFFCISLSLVHWGSSSACHTGSQTECEKAPFVPGYNLAGEGFDIVKMRRKGAFLINVKSYTDTCTICKNRFQGGQMQKLPSTVLDWRIFSTTAQPSSALHHTVDSLMKSSTSLINNNWKMDLTLDDTGKVIFGGSRSDIAQFAHSQNAKDKATFALHEISCTYYRRDFDGGAGRGTGATGRTHPSSAGPAHLGRGSPRCRSRRHPATTAPGCSRVGCSGCRGAGSPRLPCSRSPRRTASPLSA